jgi:hypothetical protein
LRWAIANGLAVIADDLVFEDLVRLVQDKGLGKAREMLAGSAGAGSCATGYPTGMVYSIAVTPSASDFNKVMISIALSAKVTGIIVYMAGDGVCTNGNPYNGGGSEGLVYLDLKG